VVLKKFAFNRRTRKLIVVLTATQHLWLAVHWQKMSNISKTISIF